MEFLYDKLKAYGESDFYGFHMPGHKRNTKLMGNHLPYDIDITEIDGFDDLHHAEEILKDAQERAAQLYGAGETHFLINGSTVGILSAILGCTTYGGRILAARNCHKSVYHAIEMQALHPVFVYPEFDVCQGINGVITPESVKEKLEEFPDIQAVMIVSPTYDGVVSDVAAIAAIVHEKGIPLIVDEAHGAHFGFHPYFPENANRLGADVVIHSLHKTMPAPTQTALLHMNGEWVNRSEVRRYLHMLQTSSPSYILMAGIDECIRLILEKGEALFDAYVQKLERAREALESLKHLRILSTEHFDKSKIVISAKDCKTDTKEIEKLLLEEYHLQMEMTAGNYLLAMTALGDTEEGFDRLVNALQEIDDQMEAKTFAEEEMFRLESAEMVFTCCRMRELLRETAVSEHLKYLPWEACEGHISTEYAYLYPPGIPILVPGERVSKRIVEQLLAYQRLHFSVQGTAREKELEVWIDG